MKHENIMLHLTRIFLAIYSCSIIGVTLFFTFFFNNLIPVSLLWQIMLVSLGATLLEFIHYKNDDIGKKEHLIRSIVHFIAINILLFSSAYFFKWFQFNDLGMLSCFAGVVFGVYILVCMFSYINDSAQARALNKKLIEYKSKRCE